MSDWQAFKRELEISQKRLAKHEELYSQTSERKWKGGQKEVGMVRQNWGEVLVLKS